MTCASWLKLLVAYKAGKSSQESTDAAAAQQETLNAFKQRAATDDAVRSESDAAVRNDLLQWSKPDSKA